MIAYTKAQLESLGFNIVYEDTTKLQFFHNEKLVTIFPYSGWFTGKSVVDGRGFHNLLIQLNLKQIKK